MGAGSNSNFILIPKNDKKPSPLPFPAKKLRADVFFVFTAQTDFVKVRNNSVPVNGF
jgi:hypothetical protein